MAGLLPEVSRLEAGEVKRRLDGGHVVIVDVRSPGAFAMRHIDGARSIPAAAVLDRASELPRDADIVFY
jgi:rhodanese-related sulfurtransferase